MKKQIWGLIIAISFGWTSMAAASQAGTKIAFGTPKLFGAGCPAGSVHFTPAPDASAFTLLFDQMILQSTKSFDSLNCQVQIPITLKKGYRLIVKTVDLRGFQDLGEDVSTLVGVQTRFATKNKKSYTKGAWAKLQKEGAFSDEFEQSFNIKDQQSYCGGMQYLVVDAGIWLNNPSAIENLVTLDSQDSQSTVTKYTIAQCK